MRFRDSIVKAPKHCTFLLLLALALLGVQRLSYAASLDAIQKTIERASWQVRRPANTPNPIPDDELKCSYSTELKETIAVLGDQNWYDWFSDIGGKGTGHEYKSAHEVVLAWKANDARSQTKFRSAILALEAALNGSKITFPTLIQQLHLGIASDDITDAVKLLLDKGFLFPILNAKNKNLPPLADRLDQLLIFIKGFEGNGVGGLGNLTFHELFYTPADSTHFSAAMIEMIDNAQSAALIPYPQVEACTEPDHVISIDKSLYMPETYSPAAIRAAFVANDRCCCRTSRKCDGIVTGATCNTCGNSACCLAGVVWCSVLVCP